MKGRFMQRITAVVLIAALVFSAGGTGVFAAGKAAVTLSKKKASVEEGKKITLKVTGNNVKKVKWSTKDKNTATVSPKGVVRGIRAGKTTILCKVRYKKTPSGKVLKKVLKCKVTVRSASPEAGTNVPEETKAPDAGTETPGNPQASSNPAVSEGPGTSTNPAASEEPGASANPAASASPLPQESLNPVEMVGADDLTLSRDSGTYDTEFELIMTSAKGACIYYTTDGSDPRTSAARKAYTSGIVVKDRENDANVLSAISPDLFEMQNYEINGNKIGSRCAAPADKDVDKCTVIRAVSCGTDGSMSDVVTKTYFIGKLSEHIDNIRQSAAAAEDGKLAVISLTMDKNDLFDPETGIYVKGKYFDNAVNEYIEKYGSLNKVDVEHDLTANFKQKGREWERNCHMEYFESDGTTTACELSLDCGVRIQGNYSREAVQKSFRLYGREEYGTKNFKYPFFGKGLKDYEGKTIQKFKTLVLRNGGNDVGNYKYKDIFTQSFIHDRAYETLTGRPCVLYLNGEYWGYYVLQDDMTDNFLQTEHGVVKENVVLYKGTDEQKYAGYGYKLDEGEFPEGVTNEDYYLRDTLDYLDGNDFSSDTVYDTFIKDFMDEQSAVDYFATMIYLNNGYDWPGKNWSIWRTTVKDETNAYSDNRWRFCVQDLDLTTEPTWSGQGTDAWQKNPLPGLAGKTSGNVIKKVFGNLMDNGKFRQKLADAVTEIGTVNYNYELVEGRAAVYKTMYGSLSGQFLKRFNSNGALYNIGEENHNANLYFLRNRPSYIPDLVASIKGYTANQE